MIILCHHSSTKEQFLLVAILHYRVLITLLPISTEARHPVLGPLTCLVLLHALTVLWFLCGVTFGG